MQGQYQISDQLLASVKSIIPLLVHLYSLYQNCEELIYGFGILLCTIYLWVVTIEATSIDTTLR